ncbi:MAG: YggS family pyridoxal phosphate-dependent enzyme [Anaerolineae bacterium]|nr:YggS family pyridoxal phosphate-dependent enzyme [Anaerolineae bacterium]
MDTIRARLDQVERCIAAACERSSRAPDEVVLVAVTKTRTCEEIQAAYRCGLRHFGENRVEEAEEKLPILQAEFQADPPTWHMIGHIQSRKAARAVAVADVIHSLDSMRLAHRLNSFAEQAGKRMPVLIEANVSGEASKYGFPASTAEERQILLEELASLERLAHLDVRGLMTMAPIVPEAEEARPIFAALRQLRDILRSRLSYSAWSELSMGMTDDFEVAIEEGATLVRIGRAIFGPLQEE